MGSEPRAKHDDPTMKNMATRQSRLRGSHPTWRFQSIDAIEGSDLVGERRVGGVVAGRKRLEVVACSLDRLDE
jgi:hypothetical protein